MSKTITIQNASEIKAEGIHRHSNSKPVICITTGKVYASATDAAIAAEVHLSTMVWCLTERQKTCKGKRYCYLSRLNEYLDEFVDNVQTMYDNANKTEKKVEVVIEEVVPEPSKANEVSIPTTTTTITEPKRKANPLYKARTMINRANNIIEFFRAI